MKMKIVSAFAKKRDDGMLASVFEVIRRLQ
jgi:hypothetical protein